MGTQSVESLYRLLASLPGQDPDNHSSGAAEPLTYHRRGQWFKSSTAHYFYSNCS